MAEQPSLLEGLAGAEPTVGVAELNAAIGAAVGEAFPGPVWVRGEVQALHVSRNQHTYFELVEKHERGDQVRAAIRVALFRDDRAGVNRALARGRAAPRRRRRGANPGPGRLLPARRAAAAGDVGHRPDVHGRPAGRRPGPHPAHPGGRRDGSGSTPPAGCRRCRCASASSRAGAAPPTGTSSTSSSAAGTPSVSPTATCGCRALPRRGGSRGRCGGWRRSSSTSS